MKSMTRVIQKMLNSPYVAQHFLADYYSNYSSLSSWLNEMKVMPLYIDELQLIPQGQRPDKKDKNILKSIWYTVKRLLLSFQNDYVNIENKYTADNQLKLWINWGRDQSAVLDSLIKDSFTPESGVFVKLEITNASLVNGILSGNAPDIALNLARTEPINLGMRDALVDLSHFSDLDGVLERFQPDAEIPYRLNSALYALPETQSFYTMFYRKDIFDSLELTVPTTWTEFLSTASVIQRNNMEVYIPYTMITDSTIVNSGIGSLNLFATLIGQSGLSLYNSGQNATALDNPDAISVFDYWIRLYKDYEFLKEADFYNRFRVGVMPLGISHYSTYMTLYSAAPELQGRWEIACVPGLSEDKNSIAGAGTGCAIVKSSKNSDGAWEFLKWWTSAGTQTKYSNNVESLLGMLGRPQTATVEAFENLGLEKNHKEILLEQWSRVKEIPEVPGGYYLSRALDQAFWAVINKETGIKDSIVKWSKIADAEIKRKIKEYS